MFLKERLAQPMLDALPRLMNRLPRSHPKWEDIWQDHYKVKAGFGGEQQVDWYLKQSRNSCLFIPDLQLAGRSSCQIDTVVLTPSFALVLEVKNFSGTLSFDETSYHMAQKTREGKVIGYKSPVTQAWNAREELVALFGLLEIELPVYTAIALPYPSTLIEQAPKEIPVIYGYSLNHFISRLPRNGLKVPPEELAAIGQALLNHHSPFPLKDYSKIYSYDSGQLKKDVLCSECGNPGHRVSQRSFLCGSCNIVVENGFERALEDWFDFVSPSISSSQVREYLGLKDKHAAGYLMRRMGFRLNAGSRVYVRKE